MATEVTVWVDDVGKYWPTEQQADRSNLKLAIAGALPSNQAHADKFADVLVQNWSAIKPVLVAFKQA